MTKWCFVSNGRWIGATYSGPAEGLPLNTPADCEAIEGEPADLIAAGAMLPYVYTPSPAELAHEARQERDRRLQACDWTQLPDVPAETSTTWATYRQALRDITDQPGFPTDIEWPTPPGA